MENKEQNITAIEKFISKIKKTNKDISDNEILNNLISFTDNIDLKTRIYNAKDFSMLNVIAEILKTIGLEKSSNTLALFNTKYKTFMISENGLSRKEIVEVLSTRKKENDEQLSIAKKLTSNLSKIESE